MNEKAKKKSQFAVILKRLFKNKGSVIGLIIVIVFVLIAVLAPILAPYGYAEMDTKAILKGPSLEHLFGTDNMGRDIFSRMLYGTKYSLGLGLGAVLIGTVISLVIGSISGYVGGKVDNLIMRIMDIVQAIPGVLLAITISASLGAGFLNTMLAMAVGGIPNVTRLVRSSILSVRQSEYLEACTSFNCSGARNVIKHVLPNCMSPLIVQTTMGIGNHILMAAMLSYIGLGVQPPTPEWGAILSSGRGYVTDYSYMCIFPGLTIAIVVLAFNLLGDGLRDAMDPKLKN